MVHDYTEPAPSILFPSVEFDPNPWSDPTVHFPFICPRVAAHGWSKRMTMLAWFHFQIMITNLKESLETAQQVFIFLIHSPFSSPKQSFPIFFLQISSILPNVS